MKNKKDPIQRVSLLFQMESCKVSYYLSPKSREINSTVYDGIYVNCKTVLSDYRSIKINDIVELRFIINPVLMNEDFTPTAFGSLDKVDKKHCFFISVPPSFPDRLDFILNRGLKPYFYLNCEKSKHKKAIIKTCKL